MVIMTLEVIVVALLMIPTWLIQQRRMARSGQRMKMKTAQMVQMPVFLTVDSAEKHLPSGQYCRSMSVPTCLTSPIIVVIVPSPLINQMIFACTLSFTPARSHLSAATVLDLSLGRQRCTTTCARTLVKNRLYAKGAERLLPRPRSYTGTRDYQEIVFHMTVRTLKAF